MAEADLSSQRNKVAPKSSSASTNLFIGVLGYNSDLGTVGQSIQTSYNMCWLVAGLYLFSAVLMFVGLAFVYNLDKKTMAKMNEELSARKKEAEAIAQAEPIAE